MVASASPCEGPAPRRTQEERRHEAETALLAAATRLFAARGIDNTSLAEISAEAGYSRGLVNHHFGTKAALVERLAEDCQQVVAQAMPKGAPVDPVGILTRLVHAYLDIVATGSSEARVFLVMWGASFPSASALREVFVADDTRFRTAIEAVVGIGQRSGGIDPDVHASSFAVTLIAMLRGIGAQFFVDADSVDIDACRQQVVSFVSAIAPPETPTRRKRRHD